MAGDLLLRLQKAIQYPGPPSSDFDLNRDQAPKGASKGKPAAVLVGFKDGPNGYEVLLTKRAITLRQHAGQIAFPGGKKDIGDANLHETALREAFEEVGLNARQAHVLGSLASHQTVTSYSVTPVLAHINSDFAARIDTSEVSEVFWVPWAFLRDPKNYTVQSRAWYGQERKYYAAPFGPYYIWGATARMLLSIATQVSR